MSGRTSGRRRAARPSPPSLLQLRDGSAGAPPGAGGRSAVRGTDSTTGSSIRSGCRPPGFAGCPGYRVDGDRIPQGQADPAVDLRGPGGRAGALRSTLDDMLTLAEVAASNPPRECSVTRSRTHSVSTTGAACSASASVGCTASVPPGGARSAAVWHNGGTYGGGEFPGDRQGGRSGGRGVREPGTGAWLHRSTVSGGRSSTTSAGSE